MIVRTTSAVRPSPVSNEFVDVDPQETAEWLESLEAVLRTQGPERAQFLLDALHGPGPGRGYRRPVQHPHAVREHHPEGTGSPVSRRPRARAQDQERRPLERDGDGAPGRTRPPTSAGTSRPSRRPPRSTRSASTTSSAAAREHSPATSSSSRATPAPGMYARAFLEGRLTEEQLKNFRQELQPGGGLSSYPHPWLMPDFWQFPTVSMGLGPIMSIYHARYNRYLETAGWPTRAARTSGRSSATASATSRRSLGCIGLAGREKLDNLTWVINCNLQRLDGPVRGNGKIIQELEGIFRGAGWNVIKCIWGSDWDALLAATHRGAGPADDGSGGRRVPGVRVRGQEGQAGAGPREVLQHARSSRPWSRT